MKVFFCTFILIFISNVSATSQELVYGVKGGMNISKFKGNSNDPFSKYDGKVGFHVGGIMEISFGERFSLQPELLYSLEGTDINSGERVINLNKLQLPILGKYYIIKGLSAEAGPIFDYLLSAKYEASLTSQNGREKVDITDNLKSVNFGLGLGFSYKLESRIFFGLRNNLGLSNLNQEGSDNSKIRSNTFQFSAGYLF